MAGRKTIRIDAARRSVSLDGAASDFLTEQAQRFTKGNCSEFLNQLLHGQIKLDRFAPMAGASGAGGR